MRLVSKGVLFRSPGVGSLVYSHAFYTRGSGVEKMVRRSVETKNDLMDCFDEAWSDDNGKTWGPLHEKPAVEPTPQGARRLFLTPGVVVPGTDRLLTIYNEGVLPNDDALADGIKRFALRYRVSEDGGRTHTIDEPIIQRPEPEGATYTAERPFRGVIVGRNSMMTGDGNTVCIRGRNGLKILVPVQSTPLGPDGELYNPVGAYTFHDAAVLIGTMGSNGLIDWSLSAYVRLDLSQSTRGAIEPTVTQMPDGRILMVIRGSNENRPEMPGYKWFCVSDDDGATWSKPEAWTYSDGSPFYSPSSTSQLLKHSSGRVLWIGNLVPENPRGNRPRYPVMIGEVDPETYLLRRDSVIKIDTRQPDESEDVSLSNFFAHEDRVTGEGVVHLSRWMMPVWIGDAYVFRVAV